METEMHTDPTSSQTLVARLKSRVLRSRAGRLFIDKKFFHYTLVGVFISVLNIFLLWLLIDVFGIPTVISSTLVIGSTFIFRYVLFRAFGLM